jgi:hypothetical protein
MFAILVLLLVLVSSTTAGWVTSGDNMYADVPGNVGIGTTSPGAKLDVAGSIRSVGATIYAELASNEGGNVAFVNPNKTGATTRDWRIWNMTGVYGNALKFWRYYADGTNAGPSVTFWDNGNVEMTNNLTVGGNVGIGTTNPGAKLDVVSYTDYGVRGQAYSTGNMETYGGYFTAQGWKGIGVYGHASYTGDDDEAGGGHYGGYFVGESPHPLFPGPLLGGIGIYAKGGLWAGDFDGDVRIKGDIALLDGEVRGAKGFKVEGGMIESTSVHADENAIGVHGLSDKGKGVSGYSNTGFGVYGYSREGNGVRGSSPDGYAGAFMGKVRITDMPNIAVGTTVKWGLGGKGNIGKGVSSARFKENIEPLADDFHKILKTKPKSFTPKDSTVKGIGFIAEDFDELGLDHLLIYEDGRPLSIRYELISLYLLEVMKDQVATNKELKAENELLKMQLEAETESLDRRVNALENIVRQYQFIVTKELQQ